MPPVSLWRQAFFVLIGRGSSALCGRAFFIVGVPSFYSACPQLATAAHLLLLFTLVSANLFSREVKPFLSRAHTFFLVMKNVSGRLLWLCND